MSYKLCFENTPKKLPLTDAADKSVVVHGGNDGGLAFGTLRPLLDVQFKWILHAEHCSCDIHQYTDCSRDAALLYK